MDKKSKKSVVIGITVIFLAILILLGLTYAYYRTRIVGNDADKSISVVSEKLELTYINGSQIIDDGNINPGDSFTKSFTVKNTGSDTIRYGVYLENVINEFVNKEDLVLSLNCNELNESGEIIGSCGSLEDYQYPETNIKVLSNFIDSGITHEYSLTFEYKYSIGDQSEDMDKIVAGEIKIYSVNDVVDLVVDGSVLTDTDILELHSITKISRSVNNSYTFVGVEEGNHELIVKNKDGEEIARTEINIDLSTAVTVVNVAIESVENGNIILSETTSTSNYVINVGKVGFHADEIAGAIKSIRN